MMANNETGIIQPVKKVAQLVHAAGGYLLVDAVQVAGRLPIDILELGADFLILSSHKIGGPQGAGALVLGKKDLKPKPIILGGRQEFQAPCRDRKCGPVLPVLVQPRNCVQCNLLTCKK